jgi:hypothetical protein
MELAKEILTRVLVTVVSVIIVVLLLERFAKKADDHNHDDCGCGCGGGGGCGGAKKTTGAQPTLAIPAATGNWNNY